MIKTDGSLPIPKNLIVDIRRLIEETRSAVAVTVNAGLTALYWRIGKRIKEEILKGHRAEYGKRIVVSLSRQLVQEYGNSMMRRGNPERWSQSVTTYEGKTL